jgi:hypothetical protein
MAKRNEKGQFTKTQKAEDVSKAASSSKSINTTSGATGLKSSFGWVHEEFMPELSGKRAADTYQEMRNNDATVGAMFFGIEMFLRRVDWFVDSFDDSEEAEAKAKFVRECKEDMSITWSDFIAEVMSMMEHGWSWFLFQVQRWKNRVAEV